MSNAQLLWFNAVLGNRLEDIQHHLPRYAKAINTCSETALMLAARLNNTEAAEILISEEAGLLNKDGRTALIIAAISGHSEMAQLLAEHEARVQDKYGLTALMYAVCCGHVAVVDTLVQHEAGVCTTQVFMLGCLDDYYLEPSNICEMDAVSDSSSVVSAASTQVSTQVSVRMYQDKGDDIFSMSRKSLGTRAVSPYYAVPAGYTALLLAILCGDAAMVRMLQGEAHLSVAPSDDRPAITPRTLAVETRQDNILAALLEYNQDTVGSETCALYTALLKGHAPSIILLLDREKHLLSDPSISMPKHMITALEQYCKMKLADAQMPETVQILAENCLHEEGAIYQRDCRGMTLLMMAASLNASATVEFIIKHHPYILSDTDNEGKTALHYAAAANSINAVKLLQRKLIGNVDKLGRTALMCAAWNASKDTLQSLRNEATLVDKDGQSALMHLILGAASQPCYRLQRLALDMHEHLLEEVGIINSASRTALMLAVWHRFYPLALQLTAYEKGHQDRSGYTALILAALVDCDDAALIEQLSKAEASLVLSGEFGSGKSALMLAIEMNSNTTILNALLKSPLATGITDSMGRTALMYAISAKDLDLALRLSSIASETGHRCQSKGQTALIKAIIAKLDDVAIILASQPLELCKPDNKGRTALMHAISSKSVALALILSEHERHYRDDQGKTALVYAIEKRPALLYQLNLWDDALLVDKEGLTPLDAIKRQCAEHVSVKNKHTKAVMTHDLYSDLLAYSMNIPLHDPTHVHSLFKRYMYQAYDRMLLFVQQLLARRHSDRRLSLDTCEEMQSPGDPHVNSIFSPGFKLDLTVRDSPIARQWASIVLKITDTIFDIFECNVPAGRGESSDRLEFCFEIGDILDSYLQAVKEIENVHSLRDDEIYEDFCCICMDCPVKVVLIPCRHAILCERCYANIRDTCPICRVKVSDAVQLNS